MSPLYTYESKLLVVNGKLAANENCCCGECCINENFFIEGIVGPFCQAVPYGQKTITRPACAGSGPILVTVYGGVDDELLINGVVTEPGLYLDCRLGPCNCAHLIGGPAPIDSEYLSGGYSFTLNDPSFTIAAGDNYSGNTGYNLTICFSSL
jgi:hypothetical protein